jgi:two-component system, sensor histidine kinase and response regulator
MKKIYSLLAAFFSRIQSIGYSLELGYYEKRKLSIFNLLNFFGLLTGFVIPLAGLCNNDKLPQLAWIVACSPSVISIVVLTANYYRQYELSRMLYFILYPVVTSLVYAARVDAGVELFFILYGVLSVFFLQRIVNVALSFSLSIACYLAVFVIWKEYDFKLIDENYNFYFFNHVLAAAFIFLGLFLIKKENANYQQRIIKKNKELKHTAIKINHQKMELAVKAGLLEAQTKELRELDTLKNKLFSVIAHDMKTPMYALRNLFRGMQKHDLPAEEIKMMIPDVVTDLNYVTGLMDNLLQWAKSQMQSNAVRPEAVDISVVIRDVVNLLTLQAQAKKVYLKTKIDHPVYVFADKDMINLVLRNLLSNAIKFTEEEGEVLIDANETNDYVEVMVQDTGTGMSKEALKKINENNYYTTKGTSNESGTGLGLMLCKEFLAKNGGRMFVESEPGIGSVFSFTLPPLN